MDGTKEYIREMKNYIEYLKDMVLDLYDALEDDTYIPEKRLIEMDCCINQIIDERRNKDV